MLNRLYSHKSTIRVRVQNVCGKNDWGIRIGESNLKFAGIAELKIANEQIFTETV